MVKKTPTPDNPCRSVASNGRACGSVDGHYQVVVNLPEDPTRLEEFLAFAEAALLLADLAKKWASDEPPSVRKSSPRPMRVTVSIHMRPEGVSKS